SFRCQSQQECRRQNSCNIQLLTKAETSGRPLSKIVVTLSRRFEHVGKWVIIGWLLMLGAGLAGCRLSPGGAGDEVAPSAPAGAVDLVGQLTELQGAYPL